MNKIKIECSHCLLGIGYTSIIASYLLKGKCIDPLIIGLTNDKPVFDLQLSIGKISPIPIFPVINSSLYETLKFGELFPCPNVEIINTEIENCKISDFKIQPKSLAEFIFNNPSELKAFGSSIKQWGTAILTKPFLEVQNKIKRHYLSGNNNSRVGYLDGFSLYYHFAQNTNHNIKYLNSIDEIDYQRKIVFTDNFEIHYSKLISTIPINHLLRYCRINDSIPLHFEGSYFLYFTHSSSYLTNKMIYDCDLSSDILRIFSTTDFSLLVQLPTYRRGVAKFDDIIKRLKDIIPELKDLKFERELFIYMSYPIEPIDDFTTIEKIQNLKENSVIPFGRFGNWEYKDLHELNWDAIL